MKILSALILHAEDTDKNVFKNAVSNFEMEWQWLQDHEEALDLMRNGKFPLLIIDSDLSPEIISLVDKLSETLFPEAATVIMALNDKEFIHFKMHQLMFNWKDAQGDGGIQFFENPAI